MAAPDILAVATALRDLVAQLPGLAEHEGKAQVFLGPQEAWARTPAAEVIADEIDLATLAAGAHRHRVNGVYHVVFYEQIGSDPERHEPVVMGLVKALLEELVAAGFDPTLGGLTEDVRAVRVALDVTRRNNRPFRVAAVTLQLEADT